MVFVEWFFSIISQAVSFGRFVLNRLFSNSITIGFLPVFIAIIVFGAVVAYVIRPFLATGSSDVAEKGWRWTSGRVEYEYSKRRWKRISGGK